MEFEKDPDKLRDAFVSIMTKGRKNNTYKFALARFLLDYCHGGSDMETNIRYSNIAEKFFEYYWMQECKFKLRQGPVNHEPVVIQAIRKKFKKEYYPQRFEKIKKEYPQNVRECICQIKNECFDDVIPRFEDDAEQYFGRKRTRPSKRRIFYDYLAQEYGDSSNNKKIDPKGGIMLNPHAVKFLRDNHEVLLRMVILEWIKFLEKRNFGIPRMAEKISKHVSGNRNTTKFKKDLVSFSVRCFYCSCPLKHEEAHVDHVLPYDYVGATDLWNLVLACQKCNCTKSNHLPPVHYITRLAGRNDQYRKQITKLDKSLGTLGNEYDICWHYCNAEKHGYPPWPTNQYLLCNEK